MYAVAAARRDGLASSAGRPPGLSVVMAVTLGIVCLLLGFGFGGMMVSLIALALIGVALAAFAKRQLGGQTGDVLGALEQLCEAAILLIATARF